MRCTHANADHLKPGDRFMPDVPHCPGWVVTVEQFRCVDCQEWLGLGEATPPPVHEFSLAIVLADLHRLWNPGRERDERVTHAVDVWCEQFTTALDALATEGR